VAALGPGGPGSSGCDAGSNTGIDSSWNTRSGYD
jgi:hypothetical protein